MKLWFQNLKTPEFLVLAGVFLLFVFTAPFTAQSGDTSELVTNSFFLRVMHPPGYPLWTLLYHLPLKYITLTNPFHVAAIVTALISCLWIGLLLFRFKNKSSTALILVLATSVMFWRYSILPDVFALHLFFLTILYLAFLKPEMLDKKWIILLIGLSVTNHHTIVFAFPLYLYAMLYENQKQRSLNSLVLGLMAGCLYFALLTFHPKDYGSWGNLSSIKDVINHFLRVEYGTFRLQSTFQENDSAWMNFYVKNVLLNCWSLVLAFLFISFRHFADLKDLFPKMLILSVSIAAYFIMFYFGDVMPLHGFGETVFERFLLQPILLMFFLVLMMINHKGIKIPQWLFLAFIVNAGLNVTQNFKDNDYRNNTVVEDYIVNSLSSIPDKGVFLTFGDTLGASTYYVHQVLKIRQDIIHIQPSFRFIWSLEKLVSAYPGIFKNPANGLIESVNLDKTKFFLNTAPVRLPINYQVKQIGLVFEVSKAAMEKPKIIFDCDVSKNFTWRRRTRVENLSSFESSHIYDLEYGRCNYAYFLDLYKEQDLIGAKIALEKAVSLSPFSVVFRERLCHFYKESHSSELASCEETLAELIAMSNKQYYFYKYDD